MTDLYLDNFKFEEDTYGNQIRHDYHMTNITQS